MKKKSLQEFIECSDLDKYGFSGYWDESEVYEKYLFTTKAVEQENSTTDIRRADTGWLIIPTCRISRLFH